MKFANEQLREKLAAEYVLGTLSGPARRRFETKLRENPALRRAVLDWEARLLPMAASLPEIEPPARVWRAIQARIRPDKEPRSGLFANLAFWRFSSLASGLLALGLLVILVLPNRQVTIEPESHMVVIMNDVQTARPAMTATWEPARRDKERIIRIRVIGHAEMAQGTAWELWLLPGPDRQPVSLGLITTHETQTVVVPAALAAALDSAAGLAMSVEPGGGSPTGVPSGPILYAGDCMKI
ncbi:MAG: anti-sigma factor [Burkholderiales bacterium]